MPTARPPNRCNFLFAIPPVETVVLVTHYVNISALTGRGAASESNGDCTKKRCASSCTSSHRVGPTFCREGRSLAPYFYIRSIELKTDELKQINDNATNTRIRTSGSN